MMKKYKVYKIIKKFIEVEASTYDDAILICEKIKNEVNWNLSSITFEVKE